jgi:hypothetical protein
LKLPVPPKARFPVNPCFVIRSTGEQNPIKSKEDRTMCCDETSKNESKDGMGCCCSEMTKLAQKGKIDLHLIKTNKHLHQTMFIFSRVDRFSLTY